MSARRLDLRATLFAATMISVAAGTADAQLSGGQWRLSPEPNRPRAGVAVQPQPTVVVSPGMGGAILPSQPVAFNLVPTILMSDGSVWANFGFGFEPVVRPCSTPLVVSGVMPGNGGFVTQPARPLYVHPVPGQSQQVATQRQNGAMMLSGAAQLACFSRNASGSIFVFR